MSSTFKKITANPSSDPGGATQSDYDPASRLTHISLPESALNYEYDSVAGQRTRVYSTNSDLRYFYKKRGRLNTTTVIMHDRVTLSAPEVTTNTYTQLGSPENVYLPNGARTAYEYNRLNHLTNMVQFNGAEQLLVSCKLRTGSNLR